jgi:small subunit ribosomal protein S1
LRSHETSLAAHASSFSTEEIGVPLTAPDSTEIEPMQNRRSSQRMSTAWHVNDEVIGQVTGQADFGLFIRLPNGESGLVFTNEIRWAGQDTIYETGQKVKVVVTAFKPGRGLSLSIRKASIKDAFDTFLAAQSRDDRFTGRIKAIQDYGVFVTLSPGVDGLLHVSDLPDISIYGKASMGQPLDVQVVSIDEATMRVRLRLAA